MSDDVVITTEDIENWIGEDIDEKCPKCGERLVEDKTGTKWCGAHGCYWSNDPEMNGKGWP
jgi:hypothetical protein